ncbi:terminase small subunit [Ruminococcus sp.]|uniref:terminase small subunit n=1 Tax=Ruminococcus sp. TaxID=41978 RepID=UPI00389008C6
MKPREKEFCRLMTVYADPIRAAREAGYKKPERAWSELAAREEIVSEIRRRGENIRSIYESTAACGLYRLAYGGVSDALTLVFRDRLSEDDLGTLDLRSISEIKRTDKGVEIRFCDRIKAAERLAALFSTDAEQGGSTGLLDAIRLSAEALSSASGREADAV